MKSVTFCVLSSSSARRDAGTTVIIHKSERIMNVCGLVYERGESKRRKVTTAKKKKGKLKRQEKKKQYKDEAENRGEQSIANCVP